MTQSTQFLINHGLPLVFAAVLVEQLGLPLPAFPWLLAAGALSAAGQFSLLLGLGVTVLACLVADALWFYAGRYRGNRVLGLLCRISLEPDSCVRRTQDLVARYGLRGIFVAKFLPGMSTVVPPLAGLSGMPVSRFLFVDGLGSLLYGGGLLGTGYLFSQQIGQIAAAFSSVGGSTLSLILGLVALYLAYKYWQRQRLLRELRAARITVAELRDKLNAGESPLIFDLRSRAAVEQDPILIQGAIHISMDDIETRLAEFPRDRDIIVYCSCPNEASSARVALQLQRKGFARVRPLLGGIDAWRENNYPTEIRIATATTSVTHVVAELQPGASKTPASGALIERAMTANAASTGKANEEAHGAKC
jgi:membrane protein DedA with SNARE-associated domain/rhodanese-related sulfurtransferase